MSVQLQDLYRMLVELQDKQKDDQRNIYIIAGVLGGVDLALIIVIVVLFIYITQVKQQLEAFEARKRTEDEMRDQKFTAYTGEEMHRKLLAASTPAVPIGSTNGVGPASEYAFNAPYVDNRLAGQPTKLPRY